VLWSSHTGLNCRYITTVRWRSEPVYSSAWTCIAVKVTPWRLIGEWMYRFTCSCFDSSWRSVVSSRLQPLFHDEIPHGTHLRGAGLAQ
jgi:hypothetical protein